MYTARRVIRLLIAGLFIAVATLSTSQITHDLTATLAVLVCTAILTLAWAGRHQAAVYYRRRRRRSGW